MVNQHPFMIGLIVVYQYGSTINTLPELRATSASLAVLVLWETHGVGGTHGNTDASTSGQNQATKECPGWFVR